MKRVPYKSYGLIALALFLLLSLPIDSSRRLRGNLLRVVTPLSQGFQAVAGVVRAPLRMYQNWGRCEELELQVERLQAQNAQLLAEWLQLDQLKEQIPPVQSIVARVIYRDPTNWNSSLWIDAGSETVGNMIHNNSPVVLGDSLVGVIDFVGPRQSRVRLITDSGLVIAVRSLRGSIFFAKGEIQGGSEPLWRSPATHLRGIGFNYDFADSEGPARDLRETEGILAVDDLLVTTGMDGVFPAGLRVGRVTLIDPLKEGAYTYSLQASPTTANLFNLSHLFVLPPVGYEPEETAPLIGEVLPQL